MHHSSTRKTGMRNPNKCSIIMLKMPLYYYIVSMWLHAYQYIVGTCTMVFKAMLIINTTDSFSRVRMRVRYLYRGGEGGSVERELVMCIN